MYKNQDRQEFLDFLQKEQKRLSAHEKKATRYTVISFSLFLVSLLLVCLTTPPWPGPMLFAFFATSVAFVSSATDMTWAVVEHMGVLKRLLAVKREFTP